ncbi:MAG: Holliday junction resolvase RuvX [Gammaproteobacteria bacterium]|jgi:putative Holliday junction resolvase
MLALGFDFGRRRIGVAVGSDLGGKARPIADVDCRDGQPDWTRLEAIVAEWKPECLVVGLPYNMDGSESEMSRAARRFAGRLQARCRTRVQFVDERLSSREAAHRLRSARDSGERKRRTRAADVDREAAAVILQSWLDHPDQRGAEE